MPNTKKMGLGKGLSALLGDDNELSTETVMFLKTLSLLPSPFQPRKNFANDSLTDLAQSIGEKGVLQPVLVRKRSDGNYEIIAGERRWRAAKQAGLQEIPVIVKDFADKEALEVALIENILRENLNPLEEAEGYRRLMDEFKNTQEQLAKALGKSSVSLHAKNILFSGFSSMSLRNLPHSFLTQTAVKYSDFVPITAITFALFNAAKI